MNNLANKTRFQLSADSCRKLLLILLCGFQLSLSSQSYTESVCTNIDVIAFDEAHIDSISLANLHPAGHVDTIYYRDVVSPEECTWNDFQGHFDMSHWWFKADNHDGYVHTEGLPYKVALEGAQRSPRNNYKRYVASLKCIAPTSGYVGFDWNSYGGSFYDIDAFYFTINDSCVQLTRSSLTSGRFVSWFVEAGDTISLEQTSNGTTNHITTEISHFQFIPQVYRIIDRTYYVVDHYGVKTECVQRITVSRPGLEDFILPPNKDGYEAPFLSCSSSLYPEATAYPYIEGVDGKHYLSSGSLFDFSASYQDVLVAKCGGSKTINRKWTITDNCSGASITKSQIIKKKDTGPIEISCPQDQTFNISKCAVSVYIRQPRAWTSCNENIEVDVNWAYGSGSRVYSDVAPGRYEITFTATDGCGLEKTCSMWLNLVYHGQEAVSCKGDQYLTLPSSGQLSIPVSDLVTSTSSACSGNLEFEINGSKYLNLDCSDVGSNTYHIRYFDPAHPSDYKTCAINIHLSSNGVEEVTCKGNQNLTLPASGQLSIPVSDLVIRSTTACSGDLQFEINGSQYLNLGCDDVGSSDFYIKYFDPAHPSDVKSCPISINLTSNTMEDVACKGDQSYTLPASGQLSIPVSDLVVWNQTACSGDLRFEINGSTTLNLGCSDTGTKSYTIRYFDPTDPSDYKTCTINIILAYGEIEVVTCKGDQNFTLPSSGQLSIPVSDLVLRTSTVCSVDLQFEIEGSENLTLGCSDVGTNTYTIKYFDPAYPGDFQTCTINITLVYDEEEVVTCKGDQNFTLPSSGQLSIPVSDLVTRTTTVCSGSMRFEIDGNQYLNLSCSDIGWKAYTIRYFDPATPADYRTCTINIEVQDTGVETVTCKGDQNYTLPVSGQLSIPVSDLVVWTSTVCSPDLRFEIDGNLYLNLGCSDIGWETYTIRYFDPAEPSDYKTCTINIEVQDNGVESVTCKGDQNYTLPASGQLSIPVSDLVVWASSVCSGNLQFEIDGNQYLSLDCSDIGWETYTIRYFDPANPSDYETCTINIEVEDNGVEAVSCKGDQSYSLPASGQLSVPVNDLILWTSTACSGDLKFEIDGSENLTLTCSDVGTQTYTIRYFDPANPSVYETCTINIIVIGSGGAITCPYDVTIACGSDLTNLDDYGSIQVSGVPLSSVVYQEDRQISSCGIGYVLRTWTINPTCGSAQSCSQTITVEGTGGSGVITWPNDYTTDGCSGAVDLHPDALPAGFGRPSANSSGNCGMITFTYSDGASSGTQDCYYLTRTWTASNSCDATWSESFNQKLEVKDLERPVIYAPADQRVFDNSAECDGAYVTLVPTTVADCDPTITVTNNSPYASGAGANASGNYPLGETIITWTAIDRCGNQSTTTTTIEVVVEGDPALTCIGELDIELAGDSYATMGHTLTPELLVTSSNGSCGKNYQYAFSENLNDISRMLTCADIGLKGFDVYRYNGSEWVNCQAWTRITDPTGNCSKGASLASITGKIATPDGQPVRYANIELDGMDDVNSDNDGIYRVDDIPVGNTYFVEPVKEINIRNGISTSDMVMLNKHLLGVTPIASPYKLIACDVNNNQAISVGDLSQMNKLVLGSLNVLDPSWVFVRSDYQFPDPTNPFMESFPEHIEINLQSDMSDLDFIAVKRGDLNYSANPSRLDDFDIHAPTKYLNAQTEYENDGIASITISPQSEEMIDGMQFTLEFDPQQFEYVEAVSTFGLDPNLVINSTKADFGQLGIVFVNYNQQQSVDPLKLTFRSQAGQVSMSPLTMSSKIYRPEGYLNDVMHPMELRYVENLDQGLELSVAPNPFNDISQLIIESDKDQNLDISIMDISGRILSSENKSISKGTNIYTLQRTDFENAGIYVIRLSNSAISRMVRVVLID